MLNVRRHIFMSLDGLWSTGTVSRLTARHLLVSAFLSVFCIDDRPEKLPALVNFREEISKRLVNGRLDPTVRRKSQAMASVGTRVSGLNFKASRHLRGPEFPELKKFVAMASGRELQSLSSRAGGGV